MFIQVGRTHYNVNAIKFFHTSSDCTKVTLHFIDGTNEEVRFEGEDDYGSFLRELRNIKA